MTDKLPAFTTSEHNAVMHLLGQLDSGARLGPEYLYHISLTPEECGKLANTLRRTDAVWRARFTMLWGALMDAQQYGLTRIPNDKMRAFSAMATQADKEGDA